VTDAPVRILIVDDSALYRLAIRHSLQDLPGVIIVGVAKDGVDALQKIEEFAPDLLTLDVQMPDIDGIGVLREIKRRRLRTKAIMVSSLTAHGAKATMDALLEGAFDFILKPSSAESGENGRLLKDALAERIAAFRQTSRDRDALKPGAVSVPEPDTTARSSKPVSCQAVVIGVSTGGPSALKQVLPALPANLPVPVLVVQHMPAKFTGALAGRLDEICKLNVVEAASGSEVKPGSVLVAPGGRQMKLRRQDDRVIVQITDDAHENGCRPAVDYLLRSVVSVFGGDVLSVVMTGMGRDGFLGCQLLKQQGGSVFVQHPRGCVVFGMPKAVMDGGLADRVLPLSRIAPAIVSHVERSVGYNKPHGVTGKVESHERN
jgi:two-component system chemotaxis response regulator CheB